MCRGERIRVFTWCRFSYKYLPVCLAESLEVSLESCSLGCVLSWMRASEVKTKILIRTDLKKIKKSKRRGASRQRPEEGGWIVGCGSSLEFNITTKRVSVVPEKELLSTLYVDQNYF